MMDPDANYARQLEIARLFVRQADLGTPPAPEDAAELGQLILDLHEWLRKGGFPPKAFFKKK